jgi:hypothetical protein
MKKNIFFALFIVASFSSFCSDNVQPDFDKSFPFKPRQPELKPKDRSQKAKLGKTSRDQKQQKKFKKQNHPRNKQQLWD